MLTILFLIGFFAVDLHSESTTHPPESEITGVWVTADGNGHIEITIEDDKLNGVIIWAEDMYEDDGETLARDTNNPDPELRGQPIKGLNIIRGFSYSDGEWRGGRVYDPENGREYRGRIRLEENVTLRLRGYVGISAFGRTERWTRLEE